MLKLSEVEKCIKIFGNDVCHNIFEVEKKFTNILSLSLSLSLRPIDVEFMKHLHGFVNIVPVIAKADTLTIEERDSFKQRIKEDLHFHGINIYPSAYGAEDEEDAAANTKIEVCYLPSFLSSLMSFLLPCKMLFLFL